MLLERAGRGGTVEQAKRAFRDARLRYKRVESLAEYYSPGTARSMNGPVLDRAEADEPATVIPASGFQVIEEALFPEPASDWASVTTGEGAFLRRSTALVRRAAAETEPTDHHIFDALRFEIARVVTLGLAGFDVLLSGLGAPEAAAALRGVMTLTAPYRTAPGTLGEKAAWDTLDRRLAQAASVLDAQSDFEHLDRLAFIVDHANPAARALDEVRRQLHDYAS